MQHQGHHVSLSFQFEKNPRVRKTIHGFLIWLKPYSLITCIEIGRISESFCHGFSICHVFLLHSRKNICHLIPADSLQGKESMCVPLHQKRASGCGISSLIWTVKNQEVRSLFCNSDTAQLSCFRPFVSFNACRRRNRNSCKGLCTAVQ